MRNTNIVEVENLNYSYSKKEQILKNIHINVPYGSIYGFLGPNGSGKTTTLSLLLGLLKKQDGKITIFGKDLFSDRINILKKTGSNVENPSLYAHLSAKANLEIYRVLYDVPKDRIEEVLKIVGLENTGSKAVRKFSLGMKQRLAIALALLPRPQLLILDEPTNGLDPGGIIEFRNLLISLHQSHGITILISSHILSEIEKLATDVGIIFEGEMIFEGSLKELHSFKNQQTKLLLKTSDNEATVGLLAENSTEKMEDYILVHCQEKEDVAKINKILVLNGIDVYQLQTTQRNLEQMFIDLTTKR